MNYFQPKTIYVDVDDVVSRTTETYPDVVAQEFGKTVSFENLTGFDLKHCFQLTDNEFKYFFDLVHKPDFLMGFEPVEGAVQTLKAWTDMGHIIDIVTGRPTSTQEATLAWLERNDVPFRGFIMVDKYNRPGNDLCLAISKEELSMMSYDLAVEDSPDMALFLARNMEVPTALIHKPWNRECIRHDNLVRCASWNEIFPMVKELVLEGTE
ncbi:MAG: bifunctional metallophosphatase/5'-nucleotidase [Desulfobacter sp.]|uniref:5' nucleotidase, NT5C type n=1 Tax=Desulfobacter sp. TaxID=2294 RepID=UPI000E821406|nr:bifunctional metallophosphatase/5'-nucleotidase [Desulfobacter sp.]HBT88869.1 bifunctional metallophosphatase/5'-nucleotidase [Desulfobacter sp.]HRF90380.1 bifunctional metallophosphatase/5'-nucleotidase [Desulfobacter postgatei]